MTVVIHPKLKHRARKSVKSTTAIDKGGHSGNGPRPARHRKHHARASGPPGSPRGTCTKLGLKGMKVEAECSCGKHHPNVAKSTVRYI